MTISSRRVTPLVLALLTSVRIPAQEPVRDAGVVVSGSGPETFVLVTGMVGGVAGFRRLQDRLLERGHRVLIVDPYYLSIDSADVTFAAMARRVTVVLARHNVESAHLVGHAHGAGVILRLAAASPERALDLCFLDVGALPANRGPVFSTSLRLVPLISRLPGGKGLIRRRFVAGLRRSAGRHEWLDSTTERLYTEPLLANIDRVVDMAQRLSRATEPESLETLIARIRVPVTVLLGDAPHIAGASAEEIVALEPLGALLRIERLPGVGHFPHEESPDDVTRLLLTLPSTTAQRAPPVPTREIAESARRSREPALRREPAGSAGAAPGFH